MSFRMAKTLLTEHPGAYSNGSWAPGVRLTRTIMASVQPVVKATDLKTLPEGRHLSDFVKVYTDERLQVTADGENVQPDIVVQGEYGYELIDIAPNQSNVINHFKYIAAKVFKITDPADWISGAVQRP
jgi:hypothetical protein